MKTQVLQERIYRYLLSDLPEEEQSVLEQEFLADGSLFEQVWEAENQLIDNYVRGQLTSVEKDLFERNYLASPVHRQRLAFAENFVRAADSVTAPVTPDIETARSTNRRNSLLPGRNSNRLRWAMAAAVLLFAASSIWLFAETRRLREQLNQARHDVASEQRIKELEKELEAQRKQRDELAAELAAAREEQLPPTGRDTQPNQSEQPSVLSFLLSPVLMRSGGEPQELKVSKDINAILLKMRVQESDGRLFQVRLRRVDGAQIWSTSSIRARTQEKDLVVSVNIPADRIANGDYILTLSATKSANDLEEINRYFFRVIKQ